jgi:uncharacterized membrane protein YedE/YeeE
MPIVLASRAPWFVAGPLIGLLIVLLLWVTNKPLGALGGYIEFDDWATRARSTLGWRAFFIIGVVAGGTLSALAGPGWRPTLAYGSFDALLGSALWLKVTVLVGAGILIGAGGRIASGCTSGHGLCGTSLGSPASFVCTTTFMVTAIACTFAIAWVFGV